MRVVGNPQELGRVGYAGLLCLLASTLGRIQRCCLRQSVPEGSLPPWDSRSEFSSIHSILLTCESYSPTAIEDFEAVLDRESMRITGEHNHNSMLGGFCFSHALYFLSHCLLHHPFLIRHRLQSVKAPIPPSFLRQILSASRENATRLTRLLQSLQKRRLCLASSLGYCAVVAGVIHRIFEYDEDACVRESSRHNFKSTLDFLSNTGTNWRHFLQLVSLSSPSSPHLNLLAARHHSKHWPKFHH